MSGISYCASVKNDINSKLPKKNCCLRTRKNAQSVLSDPCRSTDTLSALLTLPGCDGCKCELLKSVFLEYGTVTDPLKARHLEFISHSEFERDFINRLLDEFGFSPKLSERRGYYSCYFKDGDVIKDVFGRMGVNSVVFDILNSKMIGEIRNSTNRLVNFETANIKKSIGASAKYIEAINKLDSIGALSALPPELEEAARLRIENYQMSLSELGRLTNPPVSKSGFLHRLDKILLFAEKLESRGASEKDGG